jgi:hypothetical protein
LKKGGWGDFRDISSLRKGSDKGEILDRNLGMGDPEAVY